MAAKRLAGFVVSRARISSISSVVAGIAALGFILGVAFCALLALSLTAVTTPVATMPVVTAAAVGASAYLLTHLGHVVGFTLYQALLSTLGAALSGVALARALDRLRNFPGRKSLIRIMILPLALPELVAVLGLIAVWGQRGWLSEILIGWGWEPLNVYGLSGILLAHVFFNMPLIAVMILAALEGIPCENRRLAAQLGLQGWSYFRFIEWPVIRSRLPGAAGLVFMLCVTSFTIALILGGGPGATTIEVAIYQSLYFDFAPQRAVVLALIQIGLCSVLFIASGGGARPLAVVPSLLGRNAGYRNTHSIIDVMMIALASAFLLAPLTAIVVAGLTSPLLTLIGDALLWRAILTSLSLAACASMSSLGLAWALLAAKTSLLRRRRPGWLARCFVRTATASGTLILVMPPIVLASGWFVLLYQLGAAKLMAPAVVVTINALMALPFAIQLLAPAVAESASCHDRLCMNLGLTGWRRFCLIDWPVLNRPFVLALAFAAAWSLGDLGAIALFASQDMVTLPLLLFRNLGSYRTGEAAGIALILAVICLGLLALTELVRPARHGQWAAVSVRSSRPGKRTL